MLAPLKGVGFLLRRLVPTVAGLTKTPQAFYFSACPAAKGEMLRMCQTWFSPDDQQHAHDQELFTRSWLFERNRQSSIANVRGANTCASSIARRRAFCKS